MFPFVDQSDSAIKIFGVDACRRNHSHLYRVTRWTGCGSVLAIYRGSALRAHQMVYFIPMISLEDARWSSMCGGYKTPFDPRPLLTRLETDSDTTEVWHEFWEGLHHQGDVGEASFAAVPFLVKSYRERVYLIGTSMRLSRSSNWHASKTRILTFRDGLQTTTSRRYGN